MIASPQFNISTSVSSLTGANDRILASSNGRSPSGSSSNPAKALCVGDSAAYVGPARATKSLRVTRFTSLPQIDGGVFSKHLDTIFASSLDTCAEESRCRAKLDASTRVSVVNPSLHFFRKERWNKRTMGDGTPYTGVPHSADLASSQVHGVCNMSPSNFWDGFESTDDVEPSLPLPPSLHVASMPSSLHDPSPHLAEIAFK
mmetsp:Transcript_8546/g.19151  ORF Transcript_8546/g.19151 Transcript_8546/m.19151 type:complete len:202 (-) Transcript_8546:338-943(-)